MRKSYKPPNGLQTLQEMIHNIFMKSLRRVLAFLFPTAKAAATGAMPIGARGMHHLNISHAG
jgi:hypothetical protein